MSSLAELLDVLLNTLLGELLHVLFAKPLIELFAESSLPSPLALACPFLSSWMSSSPSS